MHLFINLLIDANIKDSEFMGVQVPRGSLIFGFFVYSKKLGLSVRQLRTALNHLKATSEVTIKTTNKFSIISITNWDEYQGDDKQSDKRPTNDRQTTDKRPTTSKEVKKLRRGEGENKTTTLHPVVKELLFIDEEFHPVIARIPEDGQRKLVDDYGKDCVAKYIKAIGAWAKYPSVKSVSMTLKKWASNDGIEANSEIKKRKQALFEQTNGGNEGED
jgi:hypothetical protein